MEQRDEGFLPPDPPGPEPDLGEEQPPPQQQPGYGHQPPAQQQPPLGYQPPPGSQPPGYQSAYQQSAPGYPPPTQPGWQQPAYSRPAPGYYWAPAQPDNGPAVAGFVLSLAAGGLWLFSAGLSSIVSIICAVLGVTYSRRGKQKVQVGETQKHKDLAQVGLIMGWIMVGLATLSTIAWTLIFVLAATSESFQDDLDRELDESQTSGGVRVGVAALRVGVGLFC